MSSARSANTNLTPAGDWRELATRENDGLAVSLVWSRATNQVRVTVADSKLDDGFELEIAGADALDAFYHPFAYAADPGRRLGLPMRESLDLQPQS
jgi:hypothetical protein